MVLKGFTQAATLIAAAACVAVALTGCSAPGTPVAAPPSASATPGVPVTPTPTPTPTLEPITCETALIDAENAKLVADGLLPRVPAPYPSLDALVGAGGLRCDWVRPGTDANVWYAEWPATVGEWETLRGQLVADRYTATSDLSVIRQIPEFDSALTYRDGVIYYGSPSRIVRSVRALN